MSRVVPISVRPSSQSFTTSAPDPRADGGVRHIAMSARGIRIERQVSGIQMLLAVPICAYAGVVLTSEETADARIYRISLVHTDADLTIELHRGVDSPSIVTIWRNWAEFFGKPALYGETSSGAQREVCRSGRPRPRGRGDVIQKRRPRFLKRRRSGGWAPKTERGRGQLALR